MSQLTFEQAMQRVKVSKPAWFVNTVRTVKPGPYEMWKFSPRGSARSWEHLRFYSNYWLAYGEAQRWKSR